MMRKTQSKKIQNNSATRTIQNYLEQKLENVQDVTGRVKYNCGSKGTQFRVKEGVIGVKVKDILYVWSRPMKKYRGSMPLECEKIDPAFIRTEDATYCRRCRSWKKIAAGMKHCTCGGYLVLRRRYSTSPVDAWDGELLEVQFAKTDIRRAVRTERALAHRPKKHVQTRIMPSTAAAAERASVNTDSTSREERLLVPDKTGDGMNTVTIKSDRACSLLFVAEIKSADKNADILRFEMLRRYWPEFADIQDKNRSAAANEFRAEARRFVTSVGAPVLSEQMMESWEQVGHQQRRAKTSRRKASFENQSRKEIKKISWKNDGRHDRKDTRNQQGTVPEFASSIPHTAIRSCK